MITKESIERKIGTRFEEYAQKLDEYYENLEEITEDDNPLPYGLDLSMLSIEELDFMAEYMNSHNLT